MNCTVLLCFTILFSGLVLSYRIDKKDLPNDSNYDDDDYDYSYDDESPKEDAVVSKAPNNITTQKTATYEVTEDVDDIPNPSTKGPIITNFTTPRPLNNASVTNPSPTRRPQVENNNELNNNSNYDAKGKKNSYSILHVKAEYDDAPGPVNWGESQVHKLGIKDYIYGISKGIYNKITKLFNKDDCNDHKREFRSDDLEESHKIKNENSKTTNGFVHDFHEDTYLLSDYE